jgi:hypothetical protein
MKTIMALLMLLISTPLFADKPVCYDGSTFPACEHVPPGLQLNPGPTENNDQLAPVPSTVILLGVGVLGIAGLAVARKRKI